MPKYKVEVLITVAQTVEVEAETPEAAHREVSRADYEMPPIEEGNVLDGWEYVVYDENDNELLREED